LNVKSSRKQKNFYIVKIEGLYHNNQMEKFKSYTLKIAEENLSDLSEDEFYYHEIIGLEVYENDRLIGQISEILQPGANDVWVVKRKGKRDLLLPYIPSVVLKVDVLHSRIDVEIMDGLDDEN
ncbi:MAG: ribosome maturation factor RimM, partial [Streptococcaceae bacterium]|nr:ribosome maturation factor RimM [Streptococcaceae bacterium]